MYNTSNVCRIFYNFLYSYLWYNTMGFNVTLTLERIISMLLLYDSYRLRMLQSAESHKQTFDVAFKCFLTMRFTFSGTLKYNWSVSSTLPFTRSFLFALKVTFVWTDQYVMNVKLQCRKACEAYTSHEKCNDFAVACAILYLYEPKMVLICERKSSF